VKATPPGSQSQIYFDYRIRYLNEKPPADFRGLIALREVVSLY